ncbi:MAG: Hpt domain-containing protein [Treponema sp.]|nr:Hpt domain-containing protein [Treponema sp.]
MADDIVYVNIEDGTKRVMNNIKLYIKLLIKFKDDPNMCGIEAALAEGDMEKAQIAAHTVKGLTANLSLTELYKQCLELESQIKARSLNPDQLGIVKGVYSKTIEEIEKVVASHA